MTYLEIPRLFSSETFGTNEEVILGADLNRSVGVLPGKQRGPDPSLIFPFLHPFPLPRPPSPLPSPPPFFLSLSHSFFTAIGDSYKDTLLINFFLEKFFSEKSEHELDLKIAKFFDPKKFAEIKARIKLSVLGNEDDEFLKELGTFSVQQIREEVL